MMFAELNRKILLLLDSGNERTKNVKKNILLSVCIKGGSILLTLVLVPLTIGYVNPERYGIWLTISSVITWFNFFDLGLGNGLRNRLVTSLAANDLVKSRSLISTAYTTLAVISVFLALVFYLINTNLQWSILLGVSDNYRDEILEVVNVISLLFCVQFVLQLINTIFFAFQKPAMVSATFFIGNLLSCFFIYMLKLSGAGSLLWLGVAFFAGNLISLALFSIHFFYFSRPDLSPVLKLFSKNEVRHIFSLGSSFFIIQIGAIMQYQTANIMISHYMSPVDVTEYNIAFKLFSVVSMVFNILITPIWSASTDAMVKGDYAWFVSLETKLLGIWRKLSVSVVLILILSPIFYKIWVGDAVHVSLQTSIGIALYVIALTFSMIYVNILNGMGVVKVQFYLSIITIIFFVPLAYLLVEYYKLGLLGISIALILANLNGLIAAPLQFKKILKAKIGPGTIDKG